MGLLQLATDLFMRIMLLSTEPKAYVQFLWILNIKHAEHVLRVTNIVTGKWKEANEI